MNSDPASLDNLKDIAELPAVSWWPPALGWWMLLAIILLVAAVQIFRAIRRWQADAYRRAALAEIDTASTDSAISEILKRSALAAFPRTDVASLSGDAWCRWLSETSGLQVSGAVRQGLISGVFQDDQSSGQSELKEFAANWIRGHRSRSEDQEVRDA